jgi:hypothetical protein
VLWGGGGQLAWGQPVAEVGAILLAGADFDGSGRPSLFYQTRAGDLQRVAYDPFTGAFLSPAPLAGYEAATGAAGFATTMFAAWPADLGTAAPGVDLLAMGREPATDTYVMHAVLMQRDPQNVPRAVHVQAAPIPYDASGRVPVSCGALPVGLGAPEVVALCGHRTMGDVGAVLAWRGTIAHPDGDPGSATAPALSWTPLTPSSALPASPWPAAGTFSADIHGFTQVGAIPAGWTGVAPGTAVFVMNADKLYVVEVGTDFTPRAFAVSPTVTGFVPDTAALGRLDGSSWFHVVVSGLGTTAGNGGTLVIQRDGSGYHVAQQLGSAAHPVVIAPLTAGSPGDVLALSGRGLGPSDLMPLLNDGSGNLR